MATIYDLVSCSGDPADDINDLIWKQDTAHPMGNSVVYVNQSNFAGLGAIDQGRTYLLTLNTTSVGLVKIPRLAIGNLASCADANIDKMYKLEDCNGVEAARYVLFPAAITIDNVVNLVGECSCWKVTQESVNYTETATVATNYGDNNCAECIEALAETVCEYEERTLGHAIRVKNLVPEPPDRGFSECCYSNLVFGDLAEPTNKYHNDFTSVYYQKQSPNDTLSFSIVPASTGVAVALVDVTHGIEYPFSATNPNPDLAYFRVNWRKILSVFGEDTFTIRMTISIAGLAGQDVDSNSFILRPWSIAKADNTVRIDCNMDGTLEETLTNFKGSNYDTSLRVKGFFGNPVDEVEQKNIVFSSKKGKSYYESQITMSNDPTYVFQADNIPECISRQIREFIIFGNEFFISDYNTNNHSYRYELTPVILDSIDANDYPVNGRGVNIRMSFKNRSKNLRKNNC